MSVLDWFTFAWMARRSRKRVAERVNQPDPHPERHAQAVALARRSPWAVDDARLIVDAWHEHKPCDFDRWTDIVMQVGLEMAIELAPTNRMQP